MNATSQLGSSHIGQARTETAHRAKLRRAEAIGTSSMVSTVTVTVACHEALFKVCRITAEKDTYCQVSTTPRRKSRLGYKHCLSRRFPTIRREIILYWIFPTSWTCALLSGSSCCEPAQRPSYPTARTTEEAHHAQHQLGLNPTPNRLDPTIRTPRRHTMRNTSWG